MDSDDAVNPVLRLSALEETRQLEMARMPTIRSGESTMESATPILDAFVNAGDDAMLKMTNFSQSEFEALWNLLHGHVAQHWNVGRGQTRSFIASV